MILTKHTVNNVFYGTIEDGASAPLWSDRANRKVRAFSVFSGKTAEFWTEKAARFWLSVIGDLYRARTNRLESSE